MPKAGLGNQLFPLMKAYTFAHLNGLPIVVINYHQIKVGPYLRREKTKRTYKKYFVFQKNIFEELMDRIAVSLLKFPEVMEAPVEKTVDSQATLYRYNAMPHWSNYFDRLREQRTLVIELFWKILNGRVKAQLAALKPPVIGVHIRMGDFRKLASHEDFANVGAVRTPEQYFVEMINTIRSIHGSLLPVSIFTDGRKDELQMLFLLSNVFLIEGNSDIVDLLLLSKSKVIVVSAGSTFSYWSGFLSDAPIIMHPDHIHENLRSVGDHNKLYEGPMDVNNKLLVDSIKRIDE